MMKGRLVAAVAAAVFVSAMFFPVFLSDDAAAAPPVIGTTSLPDGKIDEPYSGTLTAAGSAPITWTIDSGSLPAGLSLSTSGEITGTPTASGMFTFTVKADDGAESSTILLSIIVRVPVSISGKVITGFDGAGLDGVRIYVNDGLTDVVVKADGTFEIIDVYIRPGEYTIKFEKKGFAVRGYFYGGLYHEELENLPLKRDTVSGDLTGLHVILLEAFVDIEGTVTHDGSPVGGVTIEVYDVETKIRYTKVTSGDGTYSFTLPVGGDYHISVNARNFTADGKEDGVSLMNLGMDGAIINFELVPKQGALYLFGLDLTHTMMLIGGILGLFMLIFVILYRIHIRKNPELSKVYSESLERKKRDQN
jgi:hypothetical protein